MLLGIGPAWAEGEEDKPSGQMIGTHAWGLNFGLTTSYGLTYRYQPSEWGIQFTYTPIIYRGAYYHDAVLRIFTAFVKSAKPTFSPISATEYEFPMYA